jgi:hypothetical protein
MEMWRLSNSLARTTDSVGRTMSTRPEVTIACHSRIIEQPLTLEAWAAPLAGQQDLYLPAYYKTEFKSIFIGEHTSYTHAWIFSALDSAVRGTSQLLLDMGLVDEAKQVVETWMGRWIHM